MAVYGIDLGTTESRIAYVDHTGRPVVLKSALGEDATPSVVYFESPESVVVGRDARDFTLLSPELVVEMVKLLMGADVRYSFHGQRHTPESISAFILREMARAAQEQTGEEVRDVVITVPARFGLLEREATRKAGQIAGLNVLGTLAEPVAIALNYQAFGEYTGIRNILVYHLGRRTFDATVICVDHDDVHVICTYGDPHLGGSDWDEVIRAFLLRGFTEQGPRLDSGGGELFAEYLATAVERLKKALSVTVARKHYMHFGGSAVQLELTREHFEELTSELLERTMEITWRTIFTAKSAGVERLDDVLLVGGMAHMPVIARTLRERFGFEAQLLDPELAVVKGAALFALMEKVKAAISDGGDSVTAEQIAEELGISVHQVENLAAGSVTTVLPRALGIKVLLADSASETDPNLAGTAIAHLLDANTPLPANTEPVMFYTVYANQREVQLELWEQTESKASEQLDYNRHIGDVFLKNLPLWPAQTPFEVVFHITETGMLRAYGREVGSGREVHVEIHAANLDEPTSPAVVTAEQHLSKTTLPPQPKVFLCHSSSDKASVRELRRRLLNDGCRPWLDEEDILPGQDWDREIRQAIRESDLVLVCLSMASINKVGYLQKEIRSVLDTADEQPEGTIFVIPARLELCEVPERLRRYHWVDLFEETGYPRLLRAIRNRGTD